MRGSFENGRLYLHLEIAGIFVKNKKTVTAVIDTGFDGYLTLPYEEAFPLGLVLVGTSAYTIADGSTMYNFVCLGNVMIDGVSTSIAIDIQPKSTILAGMKLLSRLNQTITINFQKQTIAFSKK